jgi:hypothetical protein
MILPDLRQIPIDFKLTLREAASIWRLTPETFRTYCRLPDTHELYLVHTRLGNGIILITPAAVENWLWRKERVRQRKARERRERPKTKP